MQCRSLELKHTQRPEEPLTQEAVQTASSYASKQLPLINAGDDIMRRQRLEGYLLVLQPGEDLGRLGELGAGALLPRLPRLLHGARRAQLYMLGNGIRGAVLCASCTAHPARLQACTAVHCWATASGEPCGAVLLHMLKNVRCVCRLQTSLCRKMTPMRARYEGHTGLFFWLFRTLSVVLAAASDLRSGSGAVPPAATDRCRRSASCTWHSPNAQHGPSTEAPPSYMLCLH